LLLTVVIVVFAAVLIAREIAARRRERRMREELEDLRSQLKESNRLVNVGHLVSGLAQDLKSPLQGVLGNVEVLAAGGGESDPQELKELRENVTRAAGIVRNLLAFTETTALDRRWDDLNEIVRRAIQQHRNGAKAGEGVAFRGTGRLQLVYVDGRQIERVLLTLLSHTHANGAGDIAVATRRVTAPTDRMVIDIDDPQASDADDIGAWAGDLDACRRVLQAHGGSLEVEPQGAAGVRFHMEFPITDLVES
jgi:K+-sensing histidine kinase KdpD